MKHLLFDFDGVIVDSFEVAYETMLHFQEKEVTRDQYRKLFYGNIYDASDPEIKIVDIKEYFDLYEPKLLELSPVEGMTNVLKEANEHGHTISIVSSSMNKPIHLFLEKYNLSKYVGDVYGVDDEKSKVKKIHTALTRQSAQPNESIFVTDTLGDIREATEATIQSIGVSWGFHDKETLLQGNPFAVVESATELLTTLRKGHI